MDPSKMALGVMGVGQMGRGIAQTAARAGFAVRIADRDEPTAGQGKDAIADQLAQLVVKGKLTEEVRAATLERIRVGALEEFAEADLVVEAVPEDAALKFAAFERLDRVCKPSAVLASNTSSISITAIAARTSRPDRVAGMHFMHPVPVMKLVEGIRGLQTSDATFALVRSVAEAMGKSFVEARDAPGFCVNRILMPMINEAIQALADGVASAEDIDRAMTLGTNQPMGPLTLADFIGLDTCLAIMDVLYTGFSDSKYRPSPLLKRYVAAGWLGRKAGRGFHTYDGSGRG